MRPTTYVVSGQNVITEHGVEGVAVAAQRVFDPPIDPDGAGAKGWVALFYTMRNAEGEMPSPVRRALQVTKITPVGGATTVTARISVDDKQNMLGPETFMFGSEGIVATEFEVAAGVMDQVTVQMIHVSDVGVVSTSDMHTLGWYPFTDYLLNDASGSLFGQVPRWAVSIGNDKIAVVARNTVAAPLDTTIEWHLVIVRASTGEFIETRGSLGVAVTVNPFVHLGVVTPEFVGPGAVEVDAVMTYSFGNGHKLSTNGGRDWGDLFTGTFGAGVYLGNQLHPVLLEQEL
ncbi:MAG: hypothetical protein A2139_07860 [Desulfobacca sp. RBG_16_60_12]|nr:MAG: hypothetical protein A2139_07860 [Desulfobacca sp. RBG_16_60_12]